ncbi:MAG: hemolysin family protein [Chlamydiales bacterium]|nr:hemolysin family protein [Chlamydiales bacterium]
MNLSITLLTAPLLSFICLLGSSLLAACSTALLKMGKFKSKELLRTPHPPLFFFRLLLKKCCPKGEWENIHLALSISKHLLQISYALFACFFLLTTKPFLQEELFGKHLWQTSVLWIAVPVIAVSLLFDFSFRLLATLWSKSLFKFLAPFASIYLVLLFPLVGLFMQLTRGILKKVSFIEEPLTDKTKLKEMIRESELQHHLDLNDQKLISSFIHFKERVAKEIMVPRVNIFSLEADVPIRKAVQLFASEGYSRIPLFQGTLDQIIGVVLYKDLLRYYAQPELDLNAPLENLAKPVLYAPENKRISHLLQEFRNKQIHMAIIVDEYGGTEGIVTIEDILEELVGEIEDESDIGMNQQFWAIPTGGWIVDAQMSIFDIEDRLGVPIPHGLEYETIGGYVFHCAGTIPTKGWRLLHDQFELEVLSSNERSIKKIKILPTSQKPS